MRVLYSRSHFWFGLRAGGSVGHTVGVLEELSRLAQVEVISNEPIYGMDNLPCEIVEPIRCPRGWKGELLYNLYFVPRLADRIRAFNPDFVYHRYNGYSVATARVCRQLGVPLVLEFNSSDLWKIRHWETTGSTLNPTKLLKKLILSFAEPYNLHHADLIVVVSEPLKKSLAASNVNEGRVLVNPNGVDPQKFKPAALERVSRIREELEIAFDKTVIGFAGTFGQWHGVPELAEAIIELNADPTVHSRLFFVLYGDGPLGPMIREKLRHFENVRFTGIVEYEHIQDYLAVCDILLAPHGNPLDGRDFFGSPTKLFEYMAMEKGIVASRLGQMEEVLEDGRTAILVNPGDYKDLTRGILQLVNNPEQIARLGQNARQAVMRKHTWKQNVTRLIRAFEDVRQYGEIRHV